MIKLTEGSPTPIGWFAAVDSRPSHTAAQRAGTCFDPPTSQVIDSDSGCTYTNSNPQLASMPIWGMRYRAGLLKLAARREDAIGSNQ